VIYSRTWSKTHNKNCVFVVLHLANILANTCC